MSYDYQEIVNIVVRTDAMNAQLKSMKEKFDKVREDMEHTGIKVTIKDSEYTINLNALLNATIKAEEKANKKLADDHKKALDNKTKQDKEFIATSTSAYTAYLKVLESEQKASAVRIESEQKTRAKFATLFTTGGRPLAIEDNSYSLKLQKEEARELRRYRREMDREDRDIAKALHRYRMDMDKERYNAELGEAKALHSYRKAMDKDEAKANKPSMVNVSATLRAGAGAAGMIGQYPAAGALYATANAMQALGMSTISTTKALTIFTPIIGGLVAGFGLVKFITYGAEFSRELARMSTLMLSTRATAEEFSVAMNKTADAAFRISKAFNMDAVDVVKAFKDALSSGIDVSDLERFTTIAATLSAATATGIEDTTNLLTSIKDSYNLTVSEMTHQTDLLFNSINVGKIQIPAYVNGFARLSDAGHAAGISLEDLHIAIDTMTRQGMPANRVMTSMVALIHGLQSPSDQARKAMEKLEIQFGDAAFEGRKLIDVIEDFKSKTRGGIGSLVGDVLDDERARQAMRSLMQGTNLAKTEIIPSMAEIGTNAVSADRAMNNLFDNWQKSILGITNAIKASSAETGGLLNQLFYGNDGKEKADFVAKMEKMKAVAVDGFRRLGKSDADVRNTMLEISRPDLVGGPTKARWDKGDRGDGQLDPAMTDMKKVMAEIEAVMVNTYGEVKDKALIAIREINEAYDKSLRSISKSIDDLGNHKELKKLSKIQTKEFDSRATDKQKQTIDDLKEEIELQEEKLAISKKNLEQDTAAKIAAYKDKAIQPWEDRINIASREGGDKSQLPELNRELAEAQVRFKKFMEAVQDEVANKGTLAPFVSEINNLTSAIETMRKRISFQDDKNVREAKEAEKKKAAADQLAFNKEFVSNVERLYREDLANYKKAQEERKAIFKKIDAEILDEAKRNAALQSDIQKEILGSKLSERSDDPSAQLRISRDEKEKNLADLKRIAATGGDRAGFDNAISRFRDSAGAQRDAGNSLDKRRAGRLFREDMEELSKISDLHSSRFGTEAASRKAGLSANDNSLAIRSPQELAKAAAIETKQTTEITKIVADVDLKLQVDGSLSEKSRNEIADTVVNKVKQMLKNNNPGPSTIDNSTRNASEALGITPPPPQTSVSGVSWNRSSYREGDR